MLRLLVFTGNVVHGSAGTADRDRDGRDDGGQMRRELIAGLAAGAAGTTVLNVATYLDMAIRGRPASEVPSEMAAKMAKAAGVDFAPHGDSAKGDNRKSAIGALLGYLTGLQVGMLYGLARSRMRRVPALVAGIGVGLAAMAASDVPSTLAGVTKPATWGASGWAADVVPHLAYGVVTAAAYEAIVSS